MNGGGGRAFAVIPRAMIDRRAPWLRPSPLQIFTAPPFVDFASRHVLELASGASKSESATSVLTENCVICWRSAARTTWKQSDGADLQIEALLAFCLQHLHDPALSPQLVADHLRISVRTLHSRFNQIGQTFSHWVLERLDACRVALCDPSQRALNISDIAYRWGFNDLSHFNKAFRTRFKLSPRAWRNGLEA